MTPGFAFAAPGPTDGLGSLRRGHAIHANVEGLRGSVIIATWNAGEMSAIGIRFGKALQYTNVLRDVPRDLRIGRCYFPEELLRAHGLQPRDLIPYIGSRNRVHEVLNRRRELTLNMIRRLHDGLGIPAESLIKIGQHKAA